MIPVVVANEPGRAETDTVSSLLALRYGGWTAVEEGQQTFHRVTKPSANRTLLEGATRDGESPVGES